MRRVALHTAFVAASLAAAAPPVTAQYFGQNKVQYKSFKWSILKTEHFDVHYYEGEEEAVQNAAVMAERGYRRLSRVYHRSAIRAASFVASDSAG